MTRFPREEDTKLKVRPNTFSDHDVRVPPFFGDSNEPDH
jgi:hypothetical protein